MRRRSVRVRGALFCLLGRGAHAVQTLTTELVRSIPELSRGQHHFIHTFSRIHWPTNLITIVFIGDSTARNLMQSLCAAMHVVPEPTAVPLQRGTCKGILGMNQRVKFMAVYFGNIGIDPQALAELRKAWIVPTAVYFTAGLWLVYPRPTAFALNRNWNAASYQTWLLYEYSLQVALQTYSRDEPYAILLPAAPHIMCDEKCYGDFHLSHHPMHHLACYNTLTKEANVTAEVADRDCRHGLRKRENMLRLKRRWHHAITDFRKWSAQWSWTHSPKFNISRVAPVDATTLQMNRCDALLGRDNSHFVPLLYQELQLVFCSMIEGMGIRERQCRA